MTITIVCACGQHNLVYEANLEKARCERCDTQLLKPVASSTSASELERKSA